MKRLVIVLMSVFLVTSACFAEEYTEVSSPAQIFKKGFIQVSGESEVGQTRYKAKRAAMLTAQRNLLETIQGVNIVGNTTVNDGMLTKDEIASSVKGFLKGAVVVKEEYDSAEGFARVTMRLNLRGKGSLYELLTPILQDKENTKIAISQPLFRPAKVASVEENTPVVAEKEYDGLIILVSGTSFRPALINRILSEKLDVLFDPAKIAAPMLIERGCGGYTTTEAKAKALLKTWGCTNPIIITSTKVMKGSEVIVTKEDAEAIFSQNQKNNFFSQAKVVFVL